MSRRKKAVRQRFATSIDQQTRMVAAIPSISTALLDTAHRLISMRSRLRHHLGETIVADPGTDILLDLYIHQGGPRPVTVSNACAAANVPQTTALRWVSDLQRAGLIERRADPDDGRRYYVQLTHMGVGKLERVLNGDAA